MNKFSDIYKKYMAENRSVSILNILAIVVSVALLTIVFNFSIILRDYLKYEYQILYTNSDISINNINADIYNKLMLNNKVNGGVAVEKDYIADEMTYNRQTYDLKRFSSNYNEVKKFYGDMDRLVPGTLVKGVFPRNKSEIVVNKNLFDRLNLDVDTGDKIKLSRYSYATREMIDRYYIVSGIIAVDNFYYSDSVGGFMSYMDITAEDAFNSYFYLEDRVDRHEFLDKVIMDYGLNWETNSPEVNYIYSDYQPERISFFISLAFTVIIYLLSFGGIYTVYTAIYKKRRYDYSLLYAVGATSGEIKTIIKKELLLSSIIAIPLGQILGLIIVKNFAFKRLEEVYIILNTSSFNMKIYLFPNLVVTALSFLMVNLAVYLVQNKLDPLDSYKIETLTDKDRKKLKRKRYGVYRKFFGFRKYLSKKSLMVSNTSLFFQRLSVTTAILVITLTSTSIGFIKLFVDKTADQVYDISANWKEGVQLTEDLRRGLEEFDLADYFFYQDIPAAFDINGNYKDSLFYLESNQKDPITTYYNQKVLVLDSSKLQDFFGDLSNRELENFEIGDRPFYYIDTAGVSVPGIPIVDKIGIGLSSSLYETLEVEYRLPEKMGEIEVNKETMIVVFSTEQAERIFGPQIRDLPTKLSINLKSSQDTESVIGYLEMKGIASDYTLSDHNRINRMYGILRRYSIQFSLAILFLSLVNLVNSTFFSVVSRKDEVYLLSNIGYTNTDLRKFLSFETRKILFLSCIISGLIFIFIAVYFTRTTNYAILTNTDLLPYIIGSFTLTIIIIQIVIRITNKISFDIIIVKE